MQKNYLYSVLISSLALMSSFCTNSKTMPVSKDVNNDAKNRGFAVVELFTSEGCSSCPSADKAVEELAKQYPEDVYVLAFHVDYWNRLGWTDEFSKAEYTTRQNEYATRFNLESIYTPQVVINGQQEFVGSDKAKLQSITTVELKKEPTSAIELTALPKGDKTVIVHYKWNGGEEGRLHIALVQNEATTDVKRGENGGRKLHHINIVRDYKTVSALQADGTAELKVPSGVVLSNIKIIAYLQDKEGKITAVKQMVVAGA